MKPFAFDQEQVCLIREVILQATITHRFLMVEAIANGSDALAGFYARKIVQNERASHIAWQMEHYFPSEVTA